MKHLNREVESESGRREERERERERERRREEGERERIHLRTNSLLENRCSNSLHQSGDRDLV